MDDSNDPENEEAMEVASKAETISSMCCMVGRRIQRRSRGGSLGALSRTNRSQAEGDLALSELINHREDSVVAGQATRNTNTPVHSDTPTQIQANNDPDPDNMELEQKNVEPPTTQLTSHGGATAHNNAENMAGQAAASDAPILVEASAAVQGTDVIRDPAVAVTPSVIHVGSSE